MTPPSPAALQARFAAVRRATERLTATLSAEDQVVQSMPEASPTKWHLAHTTWFYEAFILAPHRGGYRVFHQDFGYLFNSYYEAAGPRHPRPRRGMLTRPSLAEIHGYRRYVDEHLAVLVAEADEATWQTVAPLIELGLHHEQQHQELILTDILHAFAQNPLAPAAFPLVEAPPIVAPCDLGWYGFDGGLRRIGYDGGGFAYDNEGPAHLVHIEPFRLASRLITCGEFLAFIVDGGYREPRLWLADGWAAVEAQGWEAPLYWRRRQGEWWQMTLAGMLPLDRQAPVCHVGYYEADAFARWAGRRLPLEAEWEVAARTVACQGNFADAGVYRPLAAPTTGLSQMYGDAWEWTASAYLAYPGYRPPAGAIGEYNGKFMCNQFVLRGGSCATAADHIRPTYRNFFYPAQRWQFSGIRLAEDA